MTREIPARWVCARSADIPVGVRAVTVPCPAVSAVEAVVLFRDSRHPPGLALATSMFLWNRCSRTCLEENCMSERHKTHNGRDIDGRFRVRQEDVDDLLEDPA